jgi:hypothetical protein
MQLAPFSKPQMRPLSSVAEVAWVGALTQTGALSQETEACKISREMPLRDAVWHILAQARAMITATKTQDGRAAVDVVFMLNELIYTDQRIEYVTADTGDADDPRRSQIDKCSKKSADF